MKEYAPRKPFAITLLIADNPAPSIAEKLLIVQMNREYVSAPLVINRYRPGCITVNNQDYSQSLLLHDTEITPLTLTTLNDITSELLHTICEKKPSLLLVGTGQQHCFPAASLFAPLYETRIGLEVMNTQSACHTFNILVNENRSVIALLINNEK